MLKVATGLYNPVRQYCSVITTKYCRVQTKGLVKMGLIHQLHKVCHTLSAKLHPINSNSSRPKMASTGWEISRHRSSPAWCGRSKRSGRDTPVSLRGWHAASLHWTTFANSNRGKSPTSYWHLQFSDTDEGTCRFSINWPTTSSGFQIWRNLTPRTFPIWCGHLHRPTCGIQIGFGKMT